MCPCEVRWISRQLSIAGRLRMHVTLWLRRSPERGRWEIDLPTRASKNVRQASLNRTMGEGLRGDLGCTAGCGR